jgi:hypothetical protein
MKKVYIAPVLEVVNVRLNGSLLDGIGMGGESPYAHTWDAKEQQLEWDEEATPDLPHNINLWDE